MFENIRADTLRVLREDNNRLVDILNLLRISYGLHAIVIYRFGRWLRRLCKYHLGWIIAAPLYPAYWILSAGVRNIYGINLQQSANIAAGFYINHFGGIEVKNCCIGSHCNIQQQVKLGATATTDKKLVIGEGVYIGAHTHICTDVTVGDGVTIGAGAVVTQDIPPHCLAIGNPARVTKQDYDNSSLL